MDTYDESRQLHDGRSNNNPGCLPDEVTVDVTYWKANRHHPNRHLARHRVLVVVGENECPAERAHSIVSGWYGEQGFDTQIDETRLTA